MNFLVILRVAFRALARNKMRSALTMLGVIIGVASVIAMVSIGQGAQATVPCCMARLGQRVFDKGAKRLVGLADTELGLRQQFDAQRRKQGAEFGQFAAVVGCKHEFHWQIGL